MKVKNLAFLPRAETSIPVCRRDIRQINRGTETWSQLCVIGNKFVDMGD